MDSLLQTCNQNWRKPATLLGRRRVSNQHPEEQGVIRRGSRRGGSKRKELLDVVDVDGVFVGPPTCLCTECVEVTVKWLYLVLDFKGSVNYLRYLK